MKIRYDYFYFFTYNLTVISVCFNTGKDFRKYLVNPLSFYK